jgi:acid phosphatase type 7
MKSIRGTFRAAVLMGAAASVLALAAGAKAQNRNSDGNGNGNRNSNDNTWPYATTDRSPVLAVVGDISCQPGEEAAGESANEVCTDPATPPAYTSTSLRESQEATANQIEAMKPDLVALLGDLQYQVGRYSDFEQSFDLTYGAFKFLQRPAPGNHEFYDEHGETGVGGYGYFSYYNGFQLNPDGSIPMTAISDPCPIPSASCKAGKTPTADLSPQPIPRADGQAGHFEESGGLETTIPAGGAVGVGDGWYSYNLGSWHLISLNIECYTQPGGCSNAGAWFASELAWLKKDLEENHSTCTAAYWHQPLFSAANSITQEGETSQAFWQLLYEYGADLVLNGHDHLYARYRPLNPSGNYDPRKGIREFIVGTGGETLDTVVKINTTTADPTGNPNFNAENLESATGNYWGVMALTLEQNRYEWDFEPALELPGAAAAPYSDTGAGTCHGPVNGGGN